MKEEEEEVKMWKKGMGKVYKTRWRRRRKGDC